MRRIVVRPLCAAILLLSTAIMPRIVAAHPLAPVLLELEEHPGQFEVRWKTPLLGPRGVTRRPVLPTTCVRTSEPKVHDDGAIAIVRWTVDCGKKGLIGQTIAVEGLAETRTDAVIRITLADGRVVRHVLRAGAPSFLVPARSSAGDVIASYVAIGVRHILSGPDHLLFVFGLLLLVVGPRPLIGTITGFTVGHCVTLSLAALGVVHVPTRAIEVLIAFSVFTLAIELSRGPTARPTIMRRFPWAMAFVFGLLHGLGFAGALAEVGLPPGEVPLALFSFNLGIEIGQLVFVFAVLLSIRGLRLVWSRLPVWKERIPVYAMGCLSAFWCVQRVSEFLRGPLGSP